MSGSWRIHCEREDAAEEEVWTVSRSTTPGWDTDSGCGGYGLTKAEAQFLADAANEKEKRDGKEGPWKMWRDRIGGPREYTPEYAKWDGWPEK
jgi:hypothetical protein